MAVEARHLNCFPPQLIGNREIMNPIKGNTNVYNSMAGYGLPLSGTTTAESLLPAYNSVIVDSFPLKAFAGAMKCDSGITYNVPSCRKRMRDSVTPFLSYPVSQKPKTCGFFSFLGEDITLQIQNQNLEARDLIDQHMEKMKLEIEQKRKTQARKILQEIELEMVRRLRAKQIEIETIGKMNWELEERVKSLSLENQIWRDVAQTNEATVNALRTNLEQLLAQVKDERRTDDHPGAAIMDDARSCCGSNGGEEEEEREEENSSNGGGSRMCKNCGKEESCVLILPCRHLCLCTVCGSSLHICPICKSTRNTTVHINL